MRKWTVVIILAISQFVMILDSTVMNVSISTVARDLNTTISGMQAAITLYALTMAAFMLTGSKFGSIWGRHRAFKIGSVVYGIGSLITAISPTLGVLLFGWSLIEGLGAVLVIPAIAALAAVNYKGRDRIVAFSILGAITGLAAAIGPLIGGFVTTYLSWRYVFAAETITMIGVLFVSNKITDESLERKSVLDITSVILSALGMAMLVFGVLQSKTWGWITPVSTPVVAGHEVAPLGVSLVAYLILAGVLVLQQFYKRQVWLEQKGKEALLKVSLLKLPVLRSGLAVLLSQYFIIAALFFVIPVYLQTMLGYDALQTGIKLIPLSIGLVLFSVIGSRMSNRQPPKRIVRIGQLAMALGAGLILSAINPQLSEVTFWIGMFTIGVGFGLIASQVGNVNMSAVNAGDTVEVGGLQGTYQNLGTSFGTALVGSIFMLALSSGFIDAVSSSSLSQNAKNTIVEQSGESVPIISPSDLEKSVKANGGSTSTAEQVSSIYEDSQITALREGMFFVFLAAIFSLFFSRNLPFKDESALKS